MLESDPKELCLFVRFLDLGNGGDEQRDGLFLGTVDMIVAFKSTNLKDDIAVRKESSRIVAFFLFF